MCKSKLLSTVICDVNLLSTHKFELFVVFLYFVYFLCFDLHMMNIAV